MSQPRPEVVIDGQITLSAYLRSVIERRDLLRVLAWREISVKYKEAAIGILWALLRPAASVAILAVVFGRVARIPGSDELYPLRLMCGLAPWMYFSATVAESATILVSNAPLLTKVYFPRMLLPLSIVIVGLVDLLVATILLMLMMFWYGVPPGLGVFFAPLVLVVLVLLAAGVSLWVAALTIRFRDLQYVVPFVLSIGLYASPVVYSLRGVASEYRYALYLNPVAGLIEATRAVVFSTVGTEAALALGFSLVISVTLTLTGAAYFLSIERSLADRV